VKQETFVLFCECVCSEFLHPVRLFSLRTEKLGEHVVATCSASSCTTALARVEILTRDQSVVGHHRRAHRKLRNHGLRELGSKTFPRFRTQFPQSVISELPVSPTMVPNYTLITDCGNWVRKRSHVFESSSRNP
jgi:hypothetical protein